MRGKTWPEGTVQTWHYARMIMRKGKWAYLELTEEGKAYMKAYGQRPEVKARNKVRNQSSKRKAYMKVYNQTPERKARKKVYRQKPEVKAQQRSYFQTPEVKARQQTPGAKVKRRAYLQTSEVKARINEQRKNRKKMDPNFKLRACLATRMADALKGKNKSASTMKLIGCTIDSLWSHLEAQFSEGMTRENYGKWHVDHIIPCAWYELEDPRQQRACFNYRNLRPMWGSENISRSDRDNPWVVASEVETTVRRGT